MRFSQSRWRELLTVLLLALAVFLGFNANLRSIAAGDTFGARYLPLSILRNHSLLLDPVLSTVARGRNVATAHDPGDEAFWVVRGLEGHFVSKYPITVPLVIAPLYWPAVRYLDSLAWDPLAFDRVARIMEKVVASILATASVILLYILLRRRICTRDAILLSFAYAFGTTTWVISSQALWQHGFAQLLIVATMLLLTGSRTSIRVVAVGFLCTLIAAARPPDVILAAGLGLYGLWWAGRKFPLLILAGLLPVVLNLAYNLLIVGHFAGAYALLVKVSEGNGGLLDGIERLVSGPTEGVAGLLFSPTRGLFVFSPFLLFVPLYFARVLRDRYQRGLTIAITLAIVVQVIGYGALDWRQGISWGPRWLTDMLPLLIWMLPPILITLSRLEKIMFVLAFAVSVGIQFVGAFWYTGISDTALMAASAHAQDRMEPFWHVRNASFLVELQHPRAKADLFVEFQGNIDAIRLTDSLIRNDPKHREIERQLEISGWALTGGQTPADVAAVIDGKELAGTSGFFPRPDVVKALGIEAPAGWKINVPVDKLGAGRHSLTILVRSYPGSEPRVLRQREFSLPADDEQSALDGQLADAVRYAEKYLSERQHTTGYWLANYTDGLVFEKPRQELNTYTNALMLDILSPVAKVSGLEAPLSRTRDFLTRQIESAGLVRYHGLPTAPTIGSLGCAITPDTDDTALVWRVAPSENRKLLSEALGEIDKFRTTDGLYRTWLAPKDRYECIDPGHDPNPADIGIQMHLYMLLAKEVPSAARTLCQAIAREVSNRERWVYYSNAPLMVLYRQRDLRSNGCDLRFPSSAFETSVPAQAGWIELVRRLQSEIQAANAKESSMEANTLLRKLAASEFEFVRTTPPLLYHNDLTATVKRYYWSEEVGYALWIRLYYEYQKSRHATRKGYFIPEMQ